MPRKKIPSYPIMNPNVAQTQQLCQPLSAKGKSTSEPSMRESSQAARNSHMASLSTFSLNDMGRGDHLRCDICQTSDTPEWRKGPNGPRTLCNACGLRYSKQVRKTDQPKKERSYEWFMYQAPDKIVKVDSSSPLAQQQVHIQQQQQQQVQQHQPIQAHIPQGLSLSGSLPLPLTLSSPTLPRVDSPSCLVQAMAPLSLQASYSDSDTMDMEYTPETSAFSTPKSKSTKMKIDFLLN